MSGDKSSSSHFSAALLTRIILSSTLLFAISLMTGCGAKKSMSGSSSRGPSATPTTIHKLGECNRVQFSSFNLNGQIGTYYEPGTGQYRSDYLNLNLTSLPAEIFEFDTFQIQFFRWSEKSLGQKTENQIPVKMFFRDKLTGYTTGPATVDRLSKSVLETARKTFGGTWLNVTLPQFFERTMVVLTGMDLTYEAIAVKFSDTSQSTPLLAKGDVLLPAFIADPVVYRTYNPFPDLYTLHPNYHLINSGASESDFVIQIEEICRELSGVGVRVPASLEKPKIEISFVDFFLEQIKTTAAKFLNLFN